MRKSIVSIPESAEAVWLNLDRAASVEVTSEAHDHPVEHALVHGGGWRAADPGPQTFRLRFDTPQHLSRIRFRFDVTEARTQEFVLRWSGADGRAGEVVRQRWTFSPGGSVSEVEDYRVDLPAVTTLELTITPDVSGGGARASLAEWRVATYSSG